MLAAQTSIQNFLDRFNCASREVNEVAAPIWFGARGCRTLLGLREARCIPGGSRL